MTATMDKQALLSGLLPEGLRDGLPPKAGHREWIVAYLQSHFKANGYRHVAPPLVEFEDALRGRLDAGQGNSDNAFRLLDPVSQQTLVVRSDITRQVARIATTRMANESRPLRLSYSGSALRTQGTQLRPSRQVRQVGVELIGANCSAAIGELAHIVASAFDNLDIGDLTFDLAVPGLIPALCRDLSLSIEQTRSVRDALDDKDAAVLASLPQSARALTTAIMHAIGPADKALAAVNALDLQGEAGALWSIAADNITAFSDVFGAGRLHVDPGEVHGFSYQAGWALSVFSQDVRGELGRGGAYMLQGPNGNEPALGFTFYPDVFADIVRSQAEEKRIFVAYQTPEKEILGLQSDGYETVRAFARVTDIYEAAQLQNCGFVYQDQSVKAVKTR